jgi:hypothetical protein
MTKKLMAIYLILVVLLAVLVPSCEGGDGDGGTQCTIVVKATLDDSPWTGAVQYTLTGATGISPITGTAVEKSFTVDCGSWICAYVSGGPGGASFVDITPSSTQSVSNGGTITFTLNFATLPPPVDASVKFISWSINGQRVSPGIYSIKYGLNTTIDAEYEVFIAGNPNEKVVVKETDWLQYHYQGPQQSKNLHAVNSWAAVFTTPPSTKKSQMTTVGGNPAPACTMITAHYCEPVKLDVETTWEQNKGTNYTKTINWLGIPSPTDILFEEVTPFPAIVGNFTLQTWACVEVEGDVDPTNDCSGNSIILLIEITP